MNQEEKIRVIVVDDEELARTGLVQKLEQYPVIDIVGQCENGFVALKEIVELKPDVVFLDIKMPGIDGFELVEMLQEDAPAIIFVTAYDAFAVKAFEANALDYLLKPVNPERLRQSIEKLNNHISSNTAGIKKLIDQHSRKKKYENRILVRDGNHIHIIPVDQVVFFEAQDDYVAIRTENNIYLKLERLAKIESSLDPEQFKRIHRSYLVNIDFVQSIENHKLAILKTGAKIPVSRSGYSRFIQ